MNNTEIKSWESEDLMKEIVILGSTGSIGTQTLEVIDNLKNWRVKALTAYQNIDLLFKQIKKYKPKIIYALLRANYHDYMKKVKKESKFEPRPDLVCEGSL